MSKYYKRKNRKTGKIVAFILTFVLLCGVIAGFVWWVNAPNTTDKKIVITPEYNVGALDSSGAYAKSDKSIYTRDAFDCSGLEVNVAFDSTLTYKLYFYDADNAFISATAGYKTNVVAELPTSATTARIMITPDWTDVDSFNQIITSDNIEFYASQIQVIVDNPNYVEKESTDGDEASVPINLLKFSASGVAAYIKEFNSLVDGNVPVSSGSTGAALVSDPMLINENDTYVIKFKGYEDLSQGFMDNSVSGTKVIVSVYAYDAEGKALTYGAVSGAVSHFDLKNKEKTLSGSDYDWTINEDGEYVHEFNFGDKTSIAFGGTVSYVVMTVNLELLQCVDYFTFSTL